MNSRPHGAPQPADFRVEDASVPEPGVDELLLRTIYLSVVPEGHAQTGTIANGGV